MSTLKITLSDDLTDFVDRQAAAHGFASASEYLSEIIRRQRELERMREKLLEGAASGSGKLLDEEWFADLRRQATR